MNHSYVGLCSYTVSIKRSTIFCALALFNKFKHCSNFWHHDVLQTVSVTNVHPMHLTSPEAVLKTP